MWGLKQKICYKMNTDMGMNINMGFSEFKQQAHSSKLERMKIDRLYRWQRNLSVLLTWVLVKIFPKIRPNHVTGFSVLLLLVVLFLNFLPQTKLSVEVFFLIQLGLLYLTSILDQVDGEVARATKRFTAEGIYYDKSYHFFYPFIFYFTVGFQFFNVFSEPFIFVLTLLLAITTMHFRSFDLMRISIVKKIKKMVEHQHNLPEKRKSFALPKNIFSRLLFYLVSMVHSITIFWYVLVVIVMYFDQQIAFYLYGFHIVFGLLLTLWLGFWVYPKKHLIGRDDL